MLSRFTHIQLFGTLWTIARQAPLSMGFSSQDYWSGLPFPSPGDLSDSGIQPTSLTSTALARRLFTTSVTQKATIYISTLPKKYDKICTRATCGKLQTSDERMRKIKELNKWRDSPCSWIGRLSNSTLVIPNLIYRFNATLIKIPENYFMDMNKLLLKFTWRDKRHKIPNAKLKEKNKVGRLTLPTSRLTIRHSNQSTAACQRKRQPDQWNRTERPERAPHKHSLTCDKETKAVQQSKDSIFNQRHWDNRTTNAITGV